MTSALRKVTPPDGGIKLEVEAFSLGQMRRARVADIHALGITVIEVLIVLAVASALLGIGYVSIPRGGFALNQAAQGLVGDVQLARFQAISRNTYVRLDVDVASNSYSIVERDSGAVIKTVRLSGDDRTAGVQILNVDEVANAVVFDPRGIGIGSGPQTIVFGSGGASKTVSISQPGKVTIQ